MGDKPSDIFRLEDRCIGFPRKHQEAFKSSLKAMNDSVAIREEIQRSQMAMSEYMNMTKFIEEPEVQGDDDYWDCGDTAIDEFTASVVGQGNNTTATANAITTLNCKADAMAINDLHQKVSDASVRLDFSGKFKAVCCHNPSKMVLKDMYFTLKSGHIWRLDDLNGYELMKHYDAETDVKLDHYASICPRFYKFLGKSFAVWDEGDTHLVDIFRELYDLKDINRFLSFVLKSGHYLNVPYTTTDAKVMKDFGKPVYPERFNGRFDEERVSYKTAADRLCERVTSRRDRISDNIAPQANDLDISYAKAMKAKRDGRSYIQMCSDGTMVSVGEHKSQLTMSEEIEQRLIDKYLT
ncbi:hypothetical protein vBAbaMD22_125 [Acinetobacter phage vB_AbaM_D22]|nr:hypothetical protein vBAbaMD22_125 [Acinetobacter phage vB_AbaM_D22]